MDNVDTTKDDSSKEDRIFDLTKILTSLEDSIKFKIILSIIYYLEYDELLSFKNTCHYYRNLINKKMIKLYAIQGCVSDKNRRLYYYSMIDVKNTARLVLNELVDYKITTNIYQNILNLSEEKKTKGDKHFNKVCDEIGRDITRTFYTEKFVNGDGQKMLNNILTALAFIRPEIGYCQGMNFIAGALLDFLDEEKVSFYIFLSFIDNIEMNLLYLKNMPDYSVRVYQLEYYIKQFFPKLHVHFKKNQISPDMFFSKWILTIFSSYLTFNVLYKIWDVFIIDKWKAIFKFSMSFFAMMHDQLLKMDLPQFSQYFRSNQTNSSLKYTEISKYYRTFKITNKQLDFLREEYFADEVKKKLEDSNCEWEQDQNEFVEIYKNQLKKHLNEFKDKSLDLKLKIEKLNKQYEHSKKSYDQQKDTVDALKLKVEILVETKNGYENVLNNIKIKNNVGEKKKAFSLKSIPGIGHTSEVEKINKNLKSVSKDIESLNKQLAENYKQLDKKQSKLEKLSNQRETLKKLLENMMEESEKVQRDLLRNLSQKLKLTAKFVQFNKY